MTRTTTPPQHGERRCYLRGCRRPECVEANAAACKRYRTARHHHGVLRVDATPYVEVARRYAAAGWSRTEISQYSGVSDTTITNLINGKVSRLHRDIAALFDALPKRPPERDGRGYLDATATCRRGRALFRIGYTVRFLAAGLRLDAETVRRILHGKHRFVTGATARRMAALYTQHRWTPGPYHANRTTGASRDWHSPLAWDDIDDPAARPETSKPYAPPAGNGRDSMRMDELKHLLALGESEASIAKQMGSSEAYIHDLAIVLRNRKTADSNDARKAA
ncbi:hypothetical protein [Streptomyces sp. NPDC001389]|uniref:hypothetical protein n=1 Tax=Streptomyces sp. NPDC001389 TaxID=3364569 RepID=UPI003677140F